MREIMEAGGDSPQAIGQVRVNSDLLGFTEYMQDVSDNSEMGFYWEEGGCFAMAIALQDYFKSLGMSSTALFWTDGHCYAVVDGAYYDYAGIAYEHPSGQIVTRQHLIRLALNPAMGGSDPDQLRADIAEANDIIRTAVELFDENGPKD